MRRMICQIIHSSGKMGFARSKYLLTLLFLSVICTDLHAQLPVFNLSVAKTDETCLGNGTLSFSVQNIHPLAVLSYRVYLLPDVTNPVSISNPTVGLQSGTYRVVALQTLNALFNSQFTDITINNNIVTLDFDVSSLSTGCGDNGVISVLVTAGVGVSYEIISGPVTKPPQASPIFNLMPPGIYEIRVFDSCGAATVQTHTLVSGAPVINISPVVLGSQLPTCNTITASNVLSSSATTQLTYPLAVTYTITPPGGGTPTVITQNYASGPASTLPLTTDIPFYHDQPYNLSVSVTDGCGTVFTHDQIINEKLEISIIPQDAICGTYYLQTVVSLYKGPYTLNFTTFPPGFNAAAFNGSYPTFNSAQVNFGDIDNTVPFGQYVVTVTDACGRTATTSHLLQEVIIDPVVQIFPYAACQSGNSRVRIHVLPYLLFTATITAAPPGYPFTLPHDVTSYINEQGTFVIDPLSTGDYTIELTDTCGNIYDPVDFFVPEMDTNVSSIVMPDCTEPTIGTIRLVGVGTTLASVAITQAPAALPQAASLPYDVSTFISGGIFTMAGLPMGHYKFKVIDNCGVENIVTRYISGYEVTAQDLVVVPHCGAFDIQLTHESNALSPKFWLQRFNALTGNWEHPMTGEPYIENTLPTPATGFEIAGNATTLNLTFDGEFRILKSFQSYNNGNVGATKDCVVMIHEFTFDGEFEITDIEKITCDGTLADVRILTNGVPPFIFKIIKKDGVPFVIDNGNNNIFSNLEPALYNFTVQHSCGDIIPGEFDVSALPAAVTAFQPGNINTCDDSSNDGTAMFDLTTQSAIILGAQDPTEVTLTFHNSAADATAGTNAITTTQSYPSTGGETIFVRVQHNTTMCFDTASFNLVLRPYPAIQMNTRWPLCDNSSVTITADPGFLYLWSTSQTTQSITVSTPGTYTLTVTDPMTSGCSAQYSIEVFTSETPEIIDIRTVDWTANDNIIEVMLSNANTAHFEYSLDNITYQSENIFTGLEPGEYTVFVKDIYGCGMASYKVYLLSYPPFFTPNADGFNDYWKVNYSEFEPNMKTYIYDRYGKLLTGFLPDSEGWDGTLNGHRLPSTDYWFVVEREDGRVLRGHFAMKR